MFKALLKKQFREFFVGVTSGRKGSGSKKIGKVGFIVLYAICFVSLCFAFFGMSAAIAEPIVAIGQNWLFYTLMTIVALALAVVGSAFTAYTSIYNAKDNELLLSMPIPPAYLLIVRMITIFLLALMFEAVVYLPAMVYYWLLCGTTIMNVIAPIVVMFMLAFIATIISCIMGWIIGLIAVRTKNKNIATVVVSLLLIGGYYVFYFNIQKILDSVVTNLDRFQFGLHIIGDAATGKIIPLIILVVLTAVAFAITCYILSKSFIGIITKKVAGKKVVYKQHALQATNNIKKVLLRKEFKRFKNSAAYMLNCGLGIILMPLAGVLLLVKASDMGSFLELVPAGVIEVGVMCLAMLVAGMNTLTVPSVSLEGPSFWITRSLPINTYEILEAKLKLHKLLTVPPALIMLVLSSIALKVDTSVMLIMALSVYIAIIVQAQIGLILNLKMPNLDWVNETVPIKKSFAPVIAIFGSWIISAAIFGVFLLLRNKIGYAIFIDICLIVLALTSRFLGDWIRKGGVRIYEAI